MTAERLIASYLVRVSVTNGIRRIGVQVMGGSTHSFGDYPQLCEFLSRAEERAVQYTRAQAARTHDHQPNTPATGASEEDGNSEREDDVWPGQVHEDGQLE